MNKEHNLYSRYLGISNDWPLDDWSITKECFDNIMKALEKGDKKVGETLKGLDETVGAPKNKMVVFVEDTEEFLDLEGNKLGPFKKGDIANISEEIANILIVDNIQRSEKGVESAKKCEASFEAVISKASEVNGLVGSIAQSSDEQLMAVNNLAQAMNGIDQSVQSNASAADQTDSASTSLDEQVQKINQLVTQLRNYL